MEFPEESQPAWSARRHRVGPTMVNERSAKPCPYRDQGALDWLDAGLVSDPTAIEPTFPDSMGGSRPGGADDVSSGFLIVAEPCFVVGRDRLPGQTSNQTAAARTCPVDQLV